MTTLEVLKAARALISDPARWCQDDYAIDDRQVSTLPSDSDAGAWCAVGAIRAAAQENNQIVLPAQRVLAKPVTTIELVSEEAIIEYNDSHTHAEVLALFDTAIARLEREAADG
jgi:hypothetical protein